MAIDGQHGTIYRAQDAELAFTLDGDASGYTFSYAIRQPRTASAALTTTSAIAVTYSAGTDTTEIVVTLLDTETDIATGLYLHDLWRTGDGTTYPLAAGVLNVLPSAHHD